MSNIPILYSFRRCPYAIRARLAICQANIRCEIREVVLKDKPAAMLALSNKGTVPVLKTPIQGVIDQSLDVMLWALEQSDPAAWLKNGCMDLIKYNDDEFKYYLDRYKYHVAYPEHSQGYYRQQAEQFLIKLEARLQQQDGVGLSAKQISLTDMAVFPFIRQFANVDWEWFVNSPYQLLKHWYQRIEQSPLFKACMDKYPQWQADAEPIYFPA